MPVHAEVRRNATLVGFAGVAFFALQAVTGGVERPLTPQELRLLPGDVPTWLVRVLAMLLSSGAVVTAFRAWVRPAGRVAAAAAFCFAVSWLPLAVGPYVSVPLYAALGAVAAAGFVTRWLVERDRGALAAGAAAVAVVAWWQPVAGAGLTAALVAVLLVWGGTTAAPGLAAVVAGAVTGGLLSAVASPGPLREPPALDSGASPLTAAAVIVVVAGAAAAVAVVEQRWPHRRNAAVVGVSVAAAVAASTALLQGVHPVALLPVYGLLCISAGSGALASWHAVRRMPTVLATVGLVAFAAAFLVLQLLFALRA